MNREELALFITVEQTSLAAAMQKIDSNANGILFVTDETGVLRGAVSDGDIRRWILKAGNIDTTVSNIMNRNPYVMEADAEDFDPLEYMTKRSIRALPVIDIQGHIVDIFLAKELEKPQKKKVGGLENVSVVVMAGGRGTRLYPYTKILPKPLIPVGDVPIVERILDGFHEYGVNAFYMTVNYKKNMIKSYFAEAEKDYEIKYIEEEQPLGTGGGLRLIPQKFEKPVIVTNCDILIRIDYEKLYVYHQNSGNAITMVTALKNDRIPYGVIHSRENGEIDHIEEKPTRSYLINTGMYIINPEMIDLIPQDTFFHMTDLSEKAMNSGYRVGMYPVSEDSFLDMGEFAEMRRMEDKLKMEVQSHENI